jgi:3'(2'), 5'-bisphosphate nucleotidase
MFERELEVALQAADKAGKYLLDAYSRFQVIANAPASITTDADRESQEIILQCIRAAFPDDALCAEEQTASVAGRPATGSRLWVVDPIDGTRGFARKNGEFSVMVAFLHENQLAVGVVLQPAAHRLTYASRGTGCWRRDNGGDPAACRVGAARTMAEATLVQSHSRDPHKPSPELQALAPARVIESYSAGIKLAMVARGEADLYLNTYDAFHDWDIAAGHILVSEAGGTVTGLKGQVPRYGLAGAWQRDGLLASNGLVHEEAVRRLGVGD